MIFWFSQAPKPAAKDHFRRVFERFFFRKKKKKTLGCFLFPLLFFPGFTLTRAQVFSLALLFEWFWLLFSLAIYWVAPECFLSLVFVVDFFLSVDVFFRFAVWFSCPW
jgi:hypothetical protein